VRVVQEDLAQCQAVLRIELDASELESYLERAHRRLAPRVRVPGFRKGKAPRAVLERVVGRESLLEEAMELILPEATETAVRDEGLEMAGIPQVEVVEREPTTLRATIPLPAQVALGDYKEVRVVWEDVAVEQGRVIDTLEDIRRELSPWEPVERPAQMDDLVVLDVSGVCEGREILSQSDLGYIVSPDPMPVAEFGSNVEGIGQGETKTFTLLFPDDHQDPELAGKPCEFTVDAKEIKVRALPDLNDEFAKGVGPGYDSLEALKKDIEARIFTNLQEEAVQAYEEKVIETVLGKADITLAPLLVEREVGRLADELQGRVQDIVKRPMGVDEYVSLLGKTEEEIRQEMQPKAEARLRRGALLSKVGEEESLTVSDTQIDGEIDRMVNEAGPRGSEVRRHFADTQHRQSIQRSLFARMALEKLVFIAKGEYSGGVGAEHEVKSEG
jgi:trigger factor